MVILVKPIGVAEVGVGAAQSLRLLIHQRNEIRNAAGNITGQGVGCLIGGGDHQTLHQLIDGHFFPGLQPCGGGVLADALMNSLRQRIDCRWIAVFQGQITGHDLCGAGGIQLCVWILGIEHIARVTVQEDCAATGKTQLRRRWDAVRFVDAIGSAYRYCQGNEHYAYKKHLQILIFFHSKNAPVVVQ